MSRSFKIMDIDRNGSLSYDEFKRALYGYHITADEKEVQAVFEYFDLNSDGSISYNEFLRQIVGEMN